MGSSLDFGKEQILVWINHLSVVKEKHLIIQKLDEDYIFKWPKLNACLICIIIKALLRGDRN